MRVVGLGAICELDSYSIDSTRENNFRISEFALLDNGERVTLHSERGFAGKISSGDIWAHETVDSITRNVLTTVRPDEEETGEAHPWEWLAELAQSQGIAVSADDLRHVPYEVVLGDSVVRRLRQTRRTSHALPNAP